MVGVRVRVKNDRRAVGGGEFQVLWIGHAEHVEAENQTSAFPIFVLDGASRGSAAQQHRCDTTAHALLCRAGLIERGYVQAIDPSGRRK